MKILALLGKGSKGKTTTLNLLTGLLSNNFTQIDDQKHPSGSMTKDNCFVVTYKEKRLVSLLAGIPKKHWRRISNGWKTVAMERIAIYISAPAEAKGRPFGLSKAKLVMGISSGYLK